MTEGLFGITPQLEAQGRVTDSEVALVPVGGVVIPIEMFDASEDLAEYEEVYQFFELDIRNFIVTPENMDYSAGGEAIKAHLTNGELIIPPQMLEFFPDMEQGLKDAFKEVGVPYTRYLIGHQSNSINPQTGHPEFWGFFRKIFRAVTRPIRKVFKTVTGVVSDIGSAVTSALRNGIEGIVELADKAIENPYVRAVASFVAPQFAPYLNAYATLDSGDKLSASQIASLGLSGVTDFTNYQVPTEVAQAIKTGASIADGADPVQTLIGVYGDDFVEALGLTEKIDTSLSSIFGEETAQFLEERMDLKQLGADLVAGTDLSRTIANQFGDEIVGYLSSDNPALGYAGIETAIALDDGKDFNDALAIGAREYYDRDGALPNLDAIVSAVGFTGDYDFDWNQYLGDINFDWSAVGDLLPSIDFNDGGLLSAIAGYAEGAYDSLKGVFGDLSLPEFADLGVDLSGIDFSGAKFGDINWGDYNFGDFEGLNWEGMDFSGMDVRDLADFGINVGDYEGLDIDFEDLKLGDIDFPSFMLLAAKQEQEQEEELEENKLLQPDLPDIVDPRAVNIAATPASAIAQPFKNPLLG